MLEGGCVCGAIRIQTTSDVKGRTLCHCLDCRKTTGSAFSTNIIVPNDGFTLVKGTPKEFVTTGNSGKKVTSFFCGDCGSTLWREGEAFGENKVVKAGTLDGDEAMNVVAKPTDEIFLERRVAWIPEIVKAANK